jgi:hypothetical protein
VTDCAPVALFVFNRPDHTRQTLEALRRNRLSAQTPLFVFADGPKSNASDAERAQIEATRALVRSEPWTNSIKIFEAETNRGLADSIVSGVTRVLEEFDRIIVLEDDIITSPGFLEYMNRALTLYAEESRVMHISGYMYPLRTRRNGTAFLRVLSCWGWATWGRAWKHYHSDIEVHYQGLNTPHAVRKFNIEGHADFYRQLLDNRSGRIRSWAVRWYASWLAQGGLTLFPTRSLVRNIGHDGTGVHCGVDHRFDTSIADSVTVRRIPVQEDAAWRWRVDEFYRSGQVDRSLARIWLTNRFLLPLRRRLVST